MMTRSCVALQQERARFSTASSRACRRCADPRRPARATGGRPWASSRSQAAMAPSGTAIVGHDPRGIEAVAEAEHSSQAPKGLLNEKRRGDLGRRSRTQGRRPNARATTARRLRRRCGEVIREAARAQRLAGRLHALLHDEPVDDDLDVVTALFASSMSSARSDSPSMQARTKPSRRNCSSSSYAPFGRARPGPRPGSSCALLEYIARSTISSRPCRDRRVALPAAETASR